MQFYKTYRFSLISGEDSNKKIIQIEGFRYGSNNKNFERN